MGLALLHRDELREGDAVPVHIHLSVAGPSSQGREFGNAKVSSMKQVGEGLFGSSFGPAWHSAERMLNAPPGYCGAAPFMRYGQPAPVQTVRAQ